MASSFPPSPGQVASPRGRAAWTTFPFVAFNTETTGPKRNRSLVEWRRSDSRRRLREADGRPWLIRRARSRRSHRRACILTRMWRGVPGAPVLGLLRRVHPKARLVAHTRPSTCACSRSRCSARDEPARTNPVLDTCAISAPSANWRPQITVWARWPMLWRRRRPGPRRSTMPPRPPWNCCALTSVSWAIPPTAGALRPDAGTTPCSPSAASRPIRCQKVPWGCGAARPSRGRNLWLTRDDGRCEVVTRWDITVWRSGLPRGRSAGRGHCQDVSHRPDIDARVD